MQVRKKYSSIEELVKAVKTVDSEIIDLSKKHWNSIAKPLYGLGEFESLVSKICGARGTLFPSFSSAALAVFCSDNGIVKEGVSQSGQDVTAMVAGNICNEKSSVAIMAKEAGIDVFPVDMGIACKIDSLKITDLHIQRSTKDFLYEDAMSYLDAQRAVCAGANFASELCSKGYDILLEGEMGIGNTTSSAAVASVLLGMEPELLCGRGAGLSDESLQHKIFVIKEGLLKRNCNAGDVIDVLSKVGGFDICAMCGFFLGAAAEKMAVVADGMISLTAALCAFCLNQNVKDYIIPSHIGSEKACSILCSKMGFEPVLHGKMHLGEGTGAVMLVPLLKMAFAVYNKMSLFEQIGLEQYIDYEK